MARAWTTCLYAMVEDKLIVEPGADQGRIGDEWYSVADLGAELLSDYAPPAGVNGPAVQDNGVNR